MHANAQRILKKLVKKGAVSLEKLAKGFMAEAKKQLAAKRGSRTAQAVGAQASSLVRNHLRPLINGGYVKRSGRGEYTVTAKGRKLAVAPAKKAKPKKTAKKKITKKRVAKKTATKKTATKKTATKGLRTELAAIRKQLKKLQGRLAKITKKVK
jgi:hypothetical protein